MEPMSAGQGSAWLGQESPGKEAFGGGKLWIGQHTSGRAIFVFDPSEADPYADVLTFYSLTDHRLCSFPRATALQRIHPLTDEVARARAKKDYGRRAALLAAHERAQAEAKAALSERQRSAVIDAHRAYVEALGLTYAGILETDVAPRKGNATMCHACGIGLDDFAGVVCGICNGVLCSCAACTCGKRGRAKKVKSEE